MTTAAPSTTLATIQPAFTDAEWLALAASRIGPCIVTTVAERSAATARGGPGLETAYFLRWCIRGDGRHSVQAGGYGGRLAGWGSQ